jgi:hypothetical protein
MTENGIAHYNDYAGLLEAGQVVDILAIIVKSVNGLDRWDGIFKPILQSGFETNILEKRMATSFEVGSHDTSATSSTPIFDNIVVQYQDYQVSWNISRKLFLADDDEKFEVIAGIINSIIPSYQRLLRVLGLRAMTFLPDVTTDKPSNPGFYRWIPTNPIKMYNTGFTNLKKDDTQYISTALSRRTMDELARKIRSKGYGNGAIWYVLNETTAQTFNEQFDYDFLATKQLVHYFQKNTGVDALPEITGTRAFIVVSDADMPTGYILAFDPSTQGLYKRVPEKPNLRGLVPIFESDTELSTRSQAEFQVFGLGYGVINRGFGAVAYLGEFNEDTGEFEPSENYVNPNFDNALRGYTLVV